MARSDDSGSTVELASLGKKYALVVGVNTSARVRALNRLKYAEDDAQKIDWHLHHQVCNFAFSSYLVGNVATTQEVREAVGDLISRSTTKEDLLLFYFIGHGYPIKTNKGDHEIYLVTADFNPNAASNEPTSHLSLKWIQNTLIENDVPSGHVIVVLDCCYSGNVLNQPREYLENFQNSGQAYTQRDRMRTIITSTGADRVAHEDAISGHARMTGLILKALSGQDESAFRNRKVTLYSLYEYVDEQMELLIPLQRLHMWQNFLRRVVLADYSTQEPLKTSDDDFKSSAPTPPPGQQFFDETTCQRAAFKDLDPKQVTAFLQKDLVRLQDDYREGLSERVQMEELGLLQGEHPSYAALLCLGLHPSRQIAGAYTRCIQWKDTKRLNRSSDGQEYRGSLPEQFARGCDFLRKHLGEHISEKEISEQDPPELNKLPYRVLQEALANALIHREYVTEPDRKPRAEGVVVEVFSDRIEISSPGEPPVNLESLREADKKHPGSHPRNPQITRIFYLAGHVERMGTGIARIQKWTREAGLLEPHIDFNLHQQTLTVVLYRPSPPMREKAKTLPPQGGEDASSTDSPTEPEPETSTGGSELGEIGIPKLPPKKSPWFRRPRYLIAVLSIIPLIWGLVPGLSYLYNLTFPPASTTIEIASDFPTSRLDATSGLPLQNSVQMAIDKANYNHVLPGYTLKLVSYDDVGRDNRHDPQVGAKNLKHVDSQKRIHSSHK